MFKPVPMTRLRLVILERNERAVLRHLGRAGVIQLTRTPAGPDTAPLPPRQHAEELARLERIVSRLDNLRRSLNLPLGEPPPKAGEISLRDVEMNLRVFEEVSGGWLKRRQELQQRLAESAAVSGQMAGYDESDVPLDQRDDSSFLHFVTGSMPARDFEKSEAGGAVALVPLTQRDGRQLLVAMTTRQERARLDHLLQQAGFIPQPLPVKSGATTTTLSEQNRREQEQATRELDQLNTKLLSLVNEHGPAWAQFENATTTERRLLEAGQHCSRTESTILLTGWVSTGDASDLERHIQELTNGRCVVELTAAEKIRDAEIPVLLRHPRLLRPFAMLVTAYGLPKYCELEPTLFVAVSYLLMFGMMFGDAGHGFVLALLGLGIWLAKRTEGLRDVGLLLLFAGGASMISGTIYGSYFGIETFKKYALWHDPLTGDPASLMTAAIAIGVVMISLGLVLNILNLIRHRDFMGALLDKFGAAGAVFYWGALVLAMKSAAIRAHGLWLPAILLLLVAPVIGWMLKEPLQIWRRQHTGEPGHGGIFGVATESFVNAFEALLSYFANTVSFVRLAAYAMSHAALLMAAFMIADDVRHLSAGGNLLSLVVIILGNAAAIVLEGIVASVQALRLEYYEFFGKFFSGGGQPFQPFRLPMTPVAGAPPC